MNPFVEECRREWKRLGVPDPVANEMAADLEVDLADAEADGTSAEEVLGTGAFDAPAFAAAWAAERGVIPQAAEKVRTRRRVPRAAVAIAGFALVAVVGAALLLSVQASSQSRVALGGPFRVGAVQRVEWLPRIVRQGHLRLVLPRLRRAIIVPAPPAAGGRLVVVSDGSSSAARIAGAVLLIVGLVGTVLATVFAVWGRSWRRPAATG